MPTLAEINRMDRNAFIRALGAIYEHSPWVAERAWPRRPFAGVADLHDAMQAALAAASREEQVALIRAHPELAGREAGEGALTDASTGEQGRLGFLSLTREEHARMAALNRRYRERHGMPCIVALRLHASRASVQAEMERRAELDTDAEIGNALAQVGHITRGRLDQHVSGS